MVQNAMVLKLFEVLIREILKVATSPQNINACGDKLITFFEDLVVDTANSLDDKMVLPMCKAIRETLGIPKKTPAP